MRVIQTGKVNTISLRFQIIVVSILKNMNHGYFSHYIIKFLSFMPIYFTIDGVFFYRYWAGASWNR